MKEFSGKYSLRVGLGLVVGRCIVIDFHLFLSPFRHVSFP